MNRWISSPDRPAPRSLLNLPVISPAGRPRTGAGRLLRPLPPFVGEHTLIAVVRDGAALQREVPVVPNGREQSFDARHGRRRVRRAVMRAGCGANNAQSTRDQTIFQSDALCKRTNRRRDVSLHRAIKHQAILDA